MKPIIVDENLVAYCGLYCGACGAYRKGKCPGCRENAKASWCKVRSCCAENRQGSCGECGKFSDARECGNVNNFVSKIFSLIFRSDRPAGIRFIREKGRRAFAEEMASRGTQAVKK